MLQTQFGYTANQLLKTVKFNLEDIREWAILDSGVTSHFLVANAPANGVTLTTSPISMRQPDGTKVQLLYTCTLCVLQILEKAQLAHVIPGLALHLLPSAIHL